MGHQQGSATPGLASGLADLAEEGSRAPIPLTVKATMLVVGVGYNKSKTKAFLILEEASNGDIIPSSQPPPKVYDYDAFISNWKKEFEQQKKGSKE